MSELLAHVAAFGLPCDWAAIAIEPLTDDRWEVVLQGARREHVTGHLVAAVESRFLAATDRQHDDATRAHHEALAHDLVLERLLVRTSSRLHAAGIEHRALKGPAFAHTVYADPSRRSYGDLDVLVRSDRYDDAVALLCAAGGRARYPEPRPHFTSRFGKGVCIVTADELEIDVHRSFVAGPFGLTIDAADLFRDPVQLPLTGHVLALSPVTQFLHACYHVALGSLVPRLVPMRDIAEMLCRTPGVDADAAVAQAERWRARAVLQRAVLCTWNGLGLSSPHPMYRWATSYEPTPFETRALAAYTAPARSYASQVIAGLPAVRGVRAKCAYVTALLVPSRTYARQRGGYVNRVRSGITTARQMRATS